jgi:hypothetical protein
VLSAALFRYFLHLKSLNFTFAPKAVICSTKLVMTSAKRAPSEAETHSTLSRSSHAHKIQHAHEQGQTAAGIVIARHIMAVSRMAAAEDDPVRSPLESPQDKERVHPAGTWHPDNLYVGRILFAGRTGAVCTGITAPVAAKSHNFRFGAGAAVLSTSALLLFLLT